MSGGSVVAFDADDTLWHNERLFIDTQARFRELLERHIDPGVVEQRLHETEIRNLAHYGYGVKSFTLSMIETAIDLTEGRMGGREIERILHMGREMLYAPVELMDGVADVIDSLAGSRELILVTKGDLLDQETKLARSGLGDFFSSVEILSRKDRAAYEVLLEAHGVRPERFAMVGNSLRSDVLPVAEMGALAIHVPYESTWVHEDVPEARLRGVPFLRAETILEVPDLLDERLPV